MIAEIFREPGAVLAAVPVAALTLLVVVTGAGLAVLRGLATDRRALLRLAPLLLALTGGAAAVWVRTQGGLAGPAPQLAVIAAVLALLAWHVVLDPDAGATATSHQPASGGGWSAGALVAAVLLATFALGWHLRTFAGSTLVWEAPVTTGFGEAFFAHTSTLGYAVHTLVWNEGLVSNGNASLLYGAPTYALLTHAGFSTLSLRLFAALWALLLVPALWVFARRHFGPAAAAVTALVASANTYVVFYGKYGTSLSATVLACVVAAIAVGELVAPGGAVWWRGLVAGAALYLATLGYSPGRLVVIALLASLVPAVVRARRGHRQALAAIAALAVVATAVVAAERAAGGQHTFLHARGEQLFTILAEPDYVRDYLTHDSAAFNAFARWARNAGLTRLLPTAQELAAVPREGPFQPSPAQRFEVAFKVLVETLPQCYRLLSPLTMASPGHQSIFDDPPAIKAYFAPLAAFTLLGFVVSLRRARQWGHAVLLAWFVVTVFPVLLTTRFDAHRTVLLAVPLCAWTALGAVETGRALTRLGVQRAARSALGVSLGTLLLFGTWSIVVRQDTDDGVETKLLDIVADVPGPVVVGALIDVRQRTWIELGLLERTHCGRAAEGRMLDGTLREELARPESSWPQDLLDRTAEVCAHATLVLAPADSYRAAVDRLEGRGLRTRELRRPGLALWLVHEDDNPDAPSIHPCPTRNVAAEDP